MIVGLDLLLSNIQVTNITYTALRIEWCKSRAQAMRFSEEVELLLEESRRILQFFKWQESWWIARAEHKKDISVMRSEGLRAYALRQAALHADLRKHFSHIWRYVPAYIKLIVHSVT